jgi:protocatechuate 3,4-dioxygenase beta subunit
MNNIKKSVTFIGFLFILLLFPFSAIYGHAPIKGKVIDASSITALQNVAIILTHINSDQVIDETKTDAKGMYEFTDVPPGQYKVRAELEGWVAASASFIEVNVEHQAIRANFSLGIPGIIEGRVTDVKTNQPIPQATIDIMRGNNIVFSVLTNADGFYRIDQLAPRPYIARVRMDDFQSSMQLVVPISNDILTIDFSLKSPPGKLIGQVFNILTGDPICNAVIDIFENDFMINSVQSNEEGYYVICEISPGNYHVRASSADHSHELQEITFSANQLLSSDFYLEPMGCVEGNVIHKFTEEPISGVSVGFWKDGVLIDSTNTDENGFFRFKGLGDCLVLVQGRNFYEKKELVNIAPAELSTMSFNLLCREPTPPKKVVIMTLYKRFAHQVNRVNYVKWLASKDPTVVSYRIYCNQKKIGEVSAEESFVLRHRWAKGEQNYQVVAINAFGQKSLPKDGEYIEE